jgi:hypothetical protein
MSLYPNHRGKYRYIWCSKFRQKEVSILLWECKLVYVPLLQWDRRCLLSHAWRRCDHVP